MTTLNDYLGFLDKVAKRTRNERIAEMLPRLGLDKRADFEGAEAAAPAKLKQLERELKAIAKEFNFKQVELRFDAEHNTWGAAYTDAQGAVRTLNWELAHSAEYRQMLAKYKQIEESLQPPFLIEVAAKEKADKTEKIRRHC